MIVVSIKGPSLPDALQQLADASVSANVIEIRVDLLTMSMKEIHTLMRASKLPVLITLRSKGQGGEYSGSQQEQLTYLKQLAELKPAYLDIEYDLLPFTKREFPLSQQLILSFHDWSGVPNNLELLLQRMRTFPAVLYKMAVTPHSLTELIRFLDFLSNTKGDVIGVAMGELGVISRQAAKCFGSFGTFACVEKGVETALGQIPASILAERYRFAQQSKQTVLYGLIGNPISRSVSDVTHNALLRQKKADALYLKILTPVNELKECVDWIRRQNFHGISVTMPFKEAIIPYLDALTPLAQAIGAVNTLFWESDKLVGDNTDAYGAIMALNEALGTLKSKRLVLLGLGGAAKALAYAAVQAGAELVCVGRDRSKAEHFATQFGGWGLTFKELPLVVKSGYDIIVNATPVEFPIKEEWILPEALFMTMQTQPVGKVAWQKLKRPVLTGYRMFVHQAVAQWQHWRPDWNVSFEDLLTNEEKPENSCLPKGIAD